MGFSRRTARAVTAAGAFLLVLATGAAWAQQPTPEQTSAIRASCRSDFMANCSGVTPGGKDALECLKRNLGKLSEACKTAVSAIGPAPATPAAIAAPPPPAPAPSSPPAAKPVSASAPKTAAPVRPAAASAPPPSQPAPAAAAAPAAPDVMVLPPREALRIVRICAADQRMFCPDIPPGGGRIIECLVRNQPSLSPPCKDALATAR